LQFAARHSDVDLTTFNTSLRFLSKNVGEAMLGVKRSKELFDGLKVSLKGTDGTARPIADVFGDVAERLSQIESPAIRSSYLMQLFGRGGADMALMVMKGAKGIDALRAAARSSGTVMGGETLDKIEKYEESMRKWDDTILSIKVAIAERLIPAVTLLKNWLSEIIATMRNGVEKSHSFKVALLGVEAGLAVIVLSGFAAAMSSIVKILAVGARTMIAFAASTWATIAPFLPLIAIITAIVLIVNDLYVMFRGGKSAIGKFIDAMFGIGATQETVDNIKQGWKAFGDVFEQVINNCKKTWRDLGALFDSVSETLKTNWTTIENTVEAALNKMRSFIKANAPDWLVAAWDSVASRLTVVWDKIIGKLKVWAVKAGAIIKSTFKKIPGMETLMTAFSSETRAELSRRQTERAKERGVNGALYRGPSEGRADAEYSGYVRKYKKVATNKEQEAESSGITQTILRPFATIPTSTSVRNSSRSVNHTVNNTINVAAPANNQQALIANMRQMLNESNQKALGDVDDYAMQYSEVE
jgi:hypothetical protein